MKNIEIIGVPMKYGCYVNGADMAYDTLLPIINNIFVSNKKNCIAIDVNDDEVHLRNQKIKYVEQVMQINTNLYNCVLDVHKSNNIPLVVGGDHSIAIGSIKGDLDYYDGDVSVIWIDAHTDIHNDITTPSGNIHGMPLSICIGRCSNEFDIGINELNPKNIYYIGIRNYEQEEINYINSENILYYKFNDIKFNNINDVINNIIKSIKTKYVHISFDVDSIDIDEFFAVNVAIEGKYQCNGGLKFNYVKIILKELLDRLNVCTIDVVEYNPLIDYNGQCKEKMKEIFEIIRGAKYDNCK